MCRDSGCSGGIIKQLVKISSQILIGRAVLQSHQRLVVQTISVPNQQTMPVGDVLLSFTGPF
jgi:hypothetical protein